MNEKKTWKSRYSDGVNMGKKLIHLARYEILRQIL